MEKLRVECCEGAAGWDYLFGLRWSFGHSLELDWICFTSRKVVFSEIARQAIEERGEKLHA